MVNKITTPPTQNGVINKINEVIDSVPQVTSIYTPSGTDAVNGVAVSNAVATKQDTLISGTTIKTINGNSLLGSGNIDIQGGGGSYTAGTGINITNSVISADIATSVSSASTNSQSVGAKLFYDTVGDIETLLSQV